jgi:hypothetical protein
MRVDVAKRRHDSEFPSAEAFAALIARFMTRA